MTKNVDHIVCRLTVAFVWFYHGLVPKLLGPDPQELAMNMALGLDAVQAKQLSYVAGTIEIVFALSILMFWKLRWPLLLSAVLMLGLFLYCAVMVPSTLTAAFNPLTTNICAFVLSIVAYRMHKGVSKGIN